jgi:hypothetical protein
VGSHGLLEDGEKVIGERFRAGSGDGEVCGVYAVMTPTVTGQRPLKTENPFKGFA